MLWYLTHTDSKIAIRFFRKRIQQKEGIVPADSYDDLGCDWKKQGMISPFTFLSKGQKWMILTITRIGWEGKSGLLKGLCFVALGSGDLCSVNSNATSVSVHSCMCKPGKIHKIHPKLCVAFYYYPSFLFFSVCCFCHMLLICWLKMSFPFKMSVLLCMNVLPRLCELDVKEQCGDCAWRMWTLPHSLANYLALRLFFTADCGLLRVMIFQF